MTEIKVESIMRDIQEEIKKQKKIDEEMLDFLAFEISQIKLTNYNEIIEMVTKNVKMKYDASEEIKERLQNKIEKLNSDNISSQGKTVKSFNLNNITTTTELRSFLNRLDKNKNLIDLVDSNLRFSNSHLNFLQRVFNLQITQNYLSALKYFIINDFSEKQTKFNFTVEEAIKNIINLINNIKKENAIAINELYNYRNSSQEWIRLNEEKLNQHDTRFSTTEEKLNQHDTRFSTTEEKLNQHDTRFSTTEEKLNQHDTRFSTTEEKLNQHDTRFSTTEEKLNQHDTRFSTTEEKQLNQHDTRFSTTEEKLNQHDTRFSTTEEKLNQHDTRFSTTEEKLNQHDTRFSTTEEKLNQHDTRFSTTEEKLNQHEILINEFDNSRNSSQEWIKNNQIQLNSLETNFNESMITIMYNIFLNRNPAIWEIDFCKTILKSTISTYTLANMLKNYSTFRRSQKDFLKSKGILFENDKYAFKKINSQTIYFDWTDPIIVESFSQSRPYEKGTVSILSKLIKKGMNVVNIGANIGYFTLLIAKLVGPTGHVFAFEPFPKNVEFLRKNIEANGYKNVEIIQQAVSNTSRKMNLWLKDSAAWHFLSSKNFNEFEKLQVNTTSLDGFFDNKKLKIDFIMMDAEGSEKNILEGMKNTLNKNPQLEIITEYNPYAFEIAGTNAKEFLQNVRENGFSIYIINDEKENAEIITKETLLKEFSFPKYTNLLLTKDMKDL